MTTPPIKMKLLVFAHRNEAWLFLKKRGFTPLSFPFEGFYSNEEELLLITGEGQHNCTARLSSVCGRFHNTIDRVINLGIAGVLWDKVKIGGIHEIRTCYAEGEFKSFTTNTIDRADLSDCISATKRIRDKKNASHLSYFASLVDREAWAVGSVCSLFKLPFYCFKLASDRIDEQCSDVVKKGRLFGEHLYLFYDKLTLPSHPLRKVYSMEEGFYFTVSQKNLYRSLMEKLKIKYQKSEQKIISSMDTKKIMEISNVPKKRTGLLIKRMKNELKPKENIHV